VTRISGECLLTLCIDDLENISQAYEAFFTHNVPGGLV